MSRLSASLPIEVASPDTRPAAHPPTHSRKDMNRIIFSPTITVLARQVFLNPTHYPFKNPGFNGGEALAEFAGRLCYMSFGEGEMDGHKMVLGRSDSATYFRNILKQRHGSVLEHATVSLLVEGVSRSLTHELVRHRVGFAYSQLSQRYVDASNVKFVLHPGIPYGTPAYEEWFDSCMRGLEAYRALLEELAAREANGSLSTRAAKKARESAREVLPNATETKIVVTGNARAWRHWLIMRGSLGADAQFNRLAVAVLPYLKAELPLLFQDMEQAFDENREPYIAATYGSV